MNEINESNENEIIESECKRDPADCLSREQFESALTSKEAELRNECLSGENSELDAAISYYAENYTPEQLQEMRDRLKDECAIIKEKYAQSVLGDSEARKTLGTNETNWNNCIQTDECINIAQKILDDSPKSDNTANSMTSAIMGVALLASAFGDQVDIGKYIAGEPLSTDLQVGMAASIEEEDKNKKVETAKAENQSRNYTEGISLT